MGGVCYRPKNIAINKEEILKILQEPHLRESINDPTMLASGIPGSDMKTLKSEQEQGILSCANFTQIINFDTINKGDNNGLNTQILQ